MNEQKKKFFPKRLKMYQLYMHSNIKYCYNINEGKDEYNFGYIILIVLTI
jgi:hypothetical protein